MNNRRTLRSHLLALVPFLLSVTLAWAQPAWAAEELCFDFNTKVVEPLHEVAAKTGGDAVEKGTREDRTAWAALRGEVRQPISKTLERLLEYKTIQDPTIAEAKIEKVESPLYLERRRIHLLVKPFILVEVRWTEDWAFALATGTPTAPETVVISYQKTEGTSHMKHYCGTIVLRRTGAETTEISQYEQGRVTGRTPDNILEGLNLALKRLRSI